MNDDITLLTMLYRYSQRRMVVSLGLVQAHFIGDAAITRTVVDRLERQGLLYLDGVTVRLTMPGFAHAVSLSRPGASAHRLGGAGARPALERHSSVSRHVVESAGWTRVRRMRQGESAQRLASGSTTQRFAV